MRRINPLKAKKQTHKKRRKPAKGVWLKRLVILWCGLVAAGGVIGGLHWAGENDIMARLKDTMIAFISDQTIASGLVIREVYVANRQALPSEQLVAALNIELGDPILFYDVKKARERIEQLGWVRQATVERQLPDKIFITIQERKPIAIWQRNKQFTLVDSEGAEIGSKQVGRYRHLKIVVGKEAPKNAAGLIRLLANAPELEKRVVAAVWVGNRRWNMHLDNGIHVRLPEENPATAWSRLATMQKDHAIFAKDIHAIDMRQPDRLIVKMTTSGAQRLLAIDNQTDHET